MAKFDLNFWANLADQTEFREVGKPTLQQLIDLLRSDEPFPIETRRWLADMLDPQCDTYASLQIVYKRGPVPGSTSDEDDELCNKIWDIHTEERKVWRTKERAVAELSIGKTKANRLWKLVKAMRE